MEALSEGNDQEVVGNKQLRRDVKPFKYSEREVERAETGFFLCRLGYAVGHPAKSDRSVI